MYIQCWIGYKNKYVWSSFFNYGIVCVRFFICNELKFIYLIYNDNLGECYVNCVLFGLEIIMKIIDFM